MHGPGWALHESHHRPRAGMFERDDLYFVIFAMPSILLLFGGARLGWGAWAIWVGAGIAGYSAIYAIFHDVIVHKRVPHRYLPKSGYMERIVQALRTPPCRGSKGERGQLWPSRGAETRDIEGRACPPRPRRRQAACHNALNTQPSLAARLTTTRRSSAPPPLRSTLRAISP